LLSTFLSSLVEVIGIIRNDEIIADGIPERRRSAQPSQAVFGNEETTNSGRLVPPSMRLQ
jgi:hypothetical protein